MRPPIIRLAAAVLVASAGPLAAVPMKFQFGNGKPAAGYVKVPASRIYADDPGYGFEKGASVTDVACKGADPLHSGFCTSDKPFFFSVSLPEGNYRVTLLLGDPSGTSGTTVKAELRRLMLENVQTKPGAFSTKSFIVNIRTPVLSDQSKVSLRAPRETVGELWSWDKRLTLEFNGKHPALCALTIEKADVPTVFVLGDSTVCDQPKEPYASWGQMLTRFLKPDIAVANLAESGETLRGATSAHRFDKALDSMKPGDFLLVQFGHNDMKSKDPNALATYHETLRTWIARVRAKGGTPVLVTSVQRCTFQDTTITNSLAGYPDMVRQTATEEHTPLVDLHAMSKTLYEAIGPKDAIVLFKHDTPDDPKFDHTHHSPYGAYELAKCVAIGLKQACPGLAGHLTEDVLSFDPAKPDPVASFAVPPSPGFTNERPAGN
jgi:lysophospholipase L1-like esterase